METVETLIPDNEGNHLVVALSFYDDSQKTDTFQIPQEFTGLEIADISIEKLDLDLPLGIRAFYKMCGWLIKQFMQFPNAVFSFILSVPLTRWKQTTLLLRPNNTAGICSRHSIYAILTD